MLTQGPFLKDASTTGATLTKFFICVMGEAVADLWMNLLMGDCWGYSWMCWLVNCVHAACLLSEPAVKEWNIHDLCVNLQVCMEVLKTSDGFPSYMHVYVSNIEDSVILWFPSSHELRQLRAIDDLLPKLSTKVVVEKRHFIQVTHHLLSQCAFINECVKCVCPCRCRVHTCTTPPASVQNMSASHTCRGLTENNTPVNNVFIWLHPPSTASFYLTIIIPQPASIPQQQHLHSIFNKHLSINITLSMNKISILELINTSISY